MGAAVARSADFLLCGVHEWQSKNFIMIERKRESKCRILLKTRGLLSLIQPTIPVIRATAVKFIGKYRYSFQPCWSTYAISSAFLCMTGQKIPTVRCFQEQWLNQGFCISEFYFVLWDPEFWSTYTQYSMGSSNLRSIRISVPQRNL